MTTTLSVLTVVGAALVWLMHLCQRRFLGGLPPEILSPLPAISVLKPLKGVDADLEGNLRSFLDLDYPEYEILLGIQDPDDPAVAVARRVAADALARGVRARVVVDQREIGANPKVNNLANLLGMARHEVILISDSNVAVPPGYMTGMAAHMLQPGVGMVTSLFRGTSSRGFGGALEAVQLNTYVMGGVSAASGLLGRVCAVGKSMLLRRADLERIGGLGELGRYLAEDQVCGEAIHALGLGVVVCPQLIDNVLGPVSVRRFASRHLRWARIRRHISPWGYASEVLANPLLAAGAAFVLDPGWATAGLLAATMALVTGSALASERAVGVRRSPALYLLLEPLREILVGLLWPVPFLSRRVSWRGRTYRIGRRTLLESLDQVAQHLPGELDASLAAEAAPAA